jgi:hypothetical protein
MQALGLYFSYKHAVCTLHGRLMKSYYWDRNDEACQHSKEDDDMADLRYSIDACVEAARSIILLTRYIDVDNYTPSW